MTKVKCDDDICKHNKTDKKRKQYCSRKQIDLSVSWGERECNSFQARERIPDEINLPEFENDGHF